MTAPDTVNGSSLALIGAIVAVARVKRPIGGWLFYFFCQVLIGLNLILINTHWKLFLPRSWSASGHYMLYVISVHRASF